MHLRRDQLASAAFLVESTLAGGNAVAVRYSNRELDPFWGATLRFTLATVLLFAIVAIRRVTLPRGQALAGAAIYGLLTFGIGFAAAYYALDYLHAGVGQTLLALVPLATLIIAVTFHQERLRTTGVLGTLLAVTGIAVISRASLDASVPGRAVLAALVSVIAFSLGAVAVRGFPSAHPLAVNAVGSATGAGALLLIALVAGDSLTMPERGSTWVALGYLVPVGSVVVFGLYVLVLQFWSASRAAYGFVITPIVTVLLSAWLDDEPLTWALLLGGTLVLVGVYVGALRATNEQPT